MSDRAILYIAANPKGAYVVGQCISVKGISHTWSDRENGADNPDGQVHFKIVNLDLTEQEETDIINHLKKVDSTDTPTAVENI